MERVVVERSNLWLAYQSSVQTESPGVDDLAVTAR